MIYYLIGFMGAGKSSVGKFAAKRLGMEFIDLDQWIVQEHKVTISEWFEMQGEIAFRQFEREALEKVSKMYRGKDLILACGGGTPCFFNNMDFMNTYGITIFLKLKVEMLENRLRNAKSKRPLLEGVEDLNGFIWKKLKERNPYYHQSRYVIHGKLLSRNTFTRWLEDLKNEFGFTEEEE